MSKISKLIKSRDSWKESSTERGKIARKQKAEIKRIKAERDLYKSQLQETRKELEDERKKKHFPSGTKKP